MHKYMPLVRKYAAMYVNHGVEHEDLISEGLFACAYIDNKYDNPTGQHYKMEIKSRLYEMLRKQWRHNKAVRSAAKGLPRSIPFNSPVLSSKAKKQFIKDLKRTFTKKQLQTLIKRAIHNQTYKEIEPNISPEGVRSRLVWIAKKGNKKLAKYKL